MSEAVKVKDELREWVSQILGIYVKDMIDENDYERASKELVDTAEAHAANATAACRESARLLRNRIVAIRKAAERPTRGFDVCYQLSMFIDEIETAFNLGESANLKDLT